MNKVQKEKHENVSEAKQDFLKKQEIIRKQIKARWGERDERLPLKKTAI